MTRILAPALFLASLALAGADKKDPAPEPATKAPPKADVRGEVKQIQPQGKLTRLLIEGKKEKDTQYARAIAYLERDGKVYAWKDGKKVAAKISDIKVGSRVQCVFNGDLRAHGTKEILILPPVKAKK